MFSKLFGQNPDLKTLRWKFPKTEYGKQVEELKGACCNFSKLSWALASIKWTWWKLLSEKCWILPRSPILLHFCNFRRPWSTKIGQEEVKCIGVLIFFLSPGAFLCSELSFMEQRVCFVCFKEGFVFWSEVLCLFAFPIKPSSSPLTYWCGIPSGWKALWPHEILV